MNEEVWEYGDRGRGGVRGWGGLLPCQFTFIDIPRQIEIHSPPLSEYDLTSLLVVDTCCFANILYVTF
jgi:hypothetical protein